LANTLKENYEMTRGEFVNKYYEILKRALTFANKARREGLLALEEEIDEVKANERDIFEYGLQFVIMGLDCEIIDKILCNIIAQEKDDYMRILKNIQKAAVLSIQEGTNPRIMYAILNSYTDLTLDKDEMKKLSEES
jgi:flagellar motor component MotA